MPHTVETVRFLEGLDLLEAGFIQAVALAARDAIKVTEESGKQTGLFKDRSVETRGSIKGSYEGSGKGFVVFGGASRLLNSGTPPHTITGKPFLRFVVNGTVFFRRMVKHKGTAERPFVTQARDRGEQAYEWAASFYIGEAIRRAR